jgi:hypothetical protein
VVALILGPAHVATAAPLKVCAPVFLTAVGQELPPDSQGLHTTGTASLAGVPVATTNATFAPAGQPAGAILSFSGPIVFTPISGGSPTLTANVLGTVDLGSGAFPATTTSVTGTGVLAGVSGSLTFRGTENLSTRVFTETITGKVCSPIRH